MKTAFISIFITIVLATVSFGQEYQEYLSKADRSYESGDKESAKELYLKAAEKGSAEAHYALAYKYALDSLYHYTEAAQRGYGKALEQALDDLLFRADSLRRADPQKALDLYFEAKKANPTSGSNIEMIPLNCSFVSIRPLMNSPGKAG